MTTRHQRALHDVPAMRAEKRPTVDECRARLFPIEHDIQKLQKDLDAFNERIAELENEGHRGYATEMLMANAIDFARQIDELRCLLVAFAPKDAPRKSMRR
jgi:septal ring factor EnvC (AmiA/AmiB activator)